MSKEITIESVHQAFEDLKTEVQKTKVDQEKVERIQTFLDTYEDQNTKIANAEAKVLGQEGELKELKESILASAKADGKTQQEARDRVDQLEIALARASEKATQGADYRESAEYKEMNQWVINGQVPSSWLTTETLRTDVNVSGGFLVPVELDNAIVKKIVELDDMRSISRVRTLSGKSLDVPKRNTIPTATWEGETETGANSESTYELQSLVPYRLTFSTQITQDQLMNAAFDMEAEMGSDAALAFASKAGAGYVLGDGVKKPFGFMADAVVLAQVRTADTSSEVDFDSVIRITGDLELGYDPRYVMNRKTMASIRALVSTTGQPLWEPGINGGVAATLAGHPYTILPTMADEASNAYPLAFGDFRSGYTIADRTGMSVVRDDFTLKKQAIIEFTWNRWTTGDVVLPQAIRVLRCGA
jgi:HK97 family phage major capsid protein